MKYEPVIGLEIHAELKTKTKMFCDSLNDPDEKHPNINVCPVCMGHPGTLPVINKKAVEAVLKVGLALGSGIPEFSKFDRKNYFYPDLPKGYQISQYDQPLCRGGHLEIPILDRENGSQNPKSKILNPKQNPNPKFKKIRITRVHLEEDAGRLLHPEGVDYSFVDFNRAGVPLMELVTEPEMRSGKEARKFAEELQLILRYVGASDANMEKGEMRVEANISLRPAGEEKFGTKVEVKNLNSFRTVETAIRYEIERQSEVLDSGGKVVQETRGWDEAKRQTFSQRSKEEAHDYRYFPEPDLPPIRIGGISGSGPEQNQGAETIIDLDKIKLEIPELPEERRKRFKNEYGLKDEDIEIFVVDKKLGEYFEAVVSEFGVWLDALRQAQGKPVRHVQGEEEDAKKLAKLSANYIISDLKNLMVGASAAVPDLLITPENLAELITMIHTGKISSRVAKDVLKEMFATGEDPSQIVEEKGLAQVSDELALEAIVDQVIKNNPHAVEDYKKGKEASIQFLVGQIMKETKGAANPEMVRALLLTKLI